MQWSTYLRPNIHQNGPKILGVNSLNQDPMVGFQKRRRNTI
jgi:hypothetical protein